MPMQNHSGFWRSICCELYVYALHFKGIVSSAAEQDVFLHCRPST